MKTIHLTLHTYKQSARIAVFSISIGGHRLITIGGNLTQIKDQLKQQLQDYALDHLYDEAVRTMDNPDGYYTIDDSVR